MPRVSLAETIATVMADPQRFSSLGITARPPVVEREDMAPVCLPAILALVDGLRAGQLLLLR